MNKLNSIAVEYLDRKYRNSKENEEKYFFVLFAFFEFFESGIPKIDLQNERTNLNKFYLDYYFNATIIESENTIKAILSDFEFDSYTIYFPLDHFVDIMDGAIFDAEKFRQFHNAVEKKIIEEKRLAKEQETAKKLALEKENRRVLYERLKREFG